MKPKDLRKMFEAETGLEAIDGDMNAKYDYVNEYGEWLEKYAIKVCDNLDIAESVMYPFPKGDK